MGSFIADRVTGGVWYQGCSSVVKEGAGYGAEHLDLEVHRERAHPLPIAGEQRGRRL